MKAITSFIVLLVAGIGFSFAQTATTDAKPASCCQKKEASASCCKAGAKSADTKSCHGASHAAATTTSSSDAVVTKEVSSDAATVQPTRVVRRVGAKGVKAKSSTSINNKK
jgi:hypothetical protein